MSPIQKQNAIDAILARAEKYGLSLVLLIVLLVWMKPHVDDLIGDMRSSMKSTAVAVETQAVTQARQVEISAATRERVERIDSKIDSTHGMVRDIHQRLGQPVVGATENTSDQKDN
jgi:hypothetical protein